MVEKLLRQGYTDSEIKKILRPTVRALFNPKDYEDIKAFRRAVEKESYNRISAARKKIKSEKKQIIKSIKSEQAKSEQEKEYYSYITVGGQKIKVKVAA